MRETQVQSLGREDPLEKEMATHSSALAWRIPWTEEPGRLQSVGSQRVGHDWVASLSLFKAFNPLLTVLQLLNIVRKYCILKFTLNGLFELSQLWVETLPSYKTPCSLPVQPRTFRLSQRGSQQRTESFCPSWLTGICPQWVPRPHCSGCWRARRSPSRSQRWWRGGWQRWAASEWGKRRKKRKSEKGGTALLSAVCL